MNVHRRRFIKQFGLGVAGAGVLSALPGCFTPSQASFGKLPRSTPEEQGVSSVGILAFLDEAAKSTHEFHSVMMVRHGHVIAEGWWKPYRAEANHMLYSLSKSFTSTAVGFAVTEGRLTVNDPVISFFPDKLPKTVSDNLRDLKVKHLLTMSVGHAHDSLPIIEAQRDWVKTFLAQPVAHPPGSVFLYNSGATYMLSAIVQKVTGQKVIDYLRPRLYSPLDISGMTWETCPMGINTGGWGLAVRTEALAKFGQLYLQNGVWRGQPLLPAAWIHEATTFKIQQTPPKGQKLAEAKKSSDWLQGYCYQFWRCRHNAFRGDGAYGQYMIVMPDEDAVIAITCQTTDMQGELNLVWDYLLPSIKDSALPANRETHAQLEERLSALALPMPAGQLASALADRISGVRFKLDPNALNAQDVTFHFTPDRCIFDLTDSNETHPIHCGLGKWVDGQCTVPGTPPKLTVGNLLPCKVAASAVWKDENTLAMVWRYYETPHHDTVTCRFEGHSVNVEFKGSVPGQKETRPVLRGWPDD